MKKRLEKIIDFLENNKISFWSWLASFFGLITIRLLLEGLSSSFASGASFFYEAIQTFLFFCLTFFAFTIFLNYILKTELKNISNVMLFGFLLILLPPIIDYFFCGQNCVRTYEFAGTGDLLPLFLNFFGEGHTNGVTVGVKTEIILALFLIFLYVYIRTAKLFVSSVSTLASYFLFFLLATLPTYPATLFLGLENLHFDISRNDVIQLFQTTNDLFSLKNISPQDTVNLKISIIISFLLLGITSIYFLINQRQKILSFLLNARYPQLFIHWGLIVIGMGLALIYTGASFEKISFFTVLSFMLFEISVACAWLASVVPNDIFDKNT